ncbi:hypothetical protein BMW26_09215 [Microbacterium sp. 1.5R]|uniref:hypothetical protein n=1 Tax=unclassified Microbacterium TaxID=2609290 RepID=UPI00069D6229|nr:MULTISPECIES: hypothetical protein [unclassified Microbacterium]AKV85690.1 hypothetical protein AKG07_04605 [Microbacterium sp. CGR1]APH45112.1 hypothetical protein BMW26_09215 [Microbacterium sp. 1.5R]MBC6494803.1 hypothetical protein [Microbacterium sp. 4-7]
MGTNAGEQPIAGSIVIVVEAAPQGLLQYTLDPDDRQPEWQVILIAHDDAVMGAATTPEQTAELLVRGSVECIRQSIPSLEVGGLTMRPELGPNDNAQIVAAGEAIFLQSEWDAVVEQAGDLPEV